jgi:hypothetical protein
MSDDPKAPAPTVEHKPKGELVLALMLGTPILFCVTLYFLIVDLISPALLWIVYLFVRHRRCCSFILLSLHGQTRSQSGSFTEEDS